MQGALSAPNAYQEGAVEERMVMMLSKFGKREFPRTINELGFGIHAR
jgi:hypothetical protein